MLGYGLGGDVARIDVGIVETAKTSVATRVEST
jgi:hypothetical protein